MSLQWWQCTSTQIQTKDETLAVGADAKKCWVVPRVPFLQAIRPMKDGVIADFNVTERMLKAFIRKVNNGKFSAPPRIRFVCLVALPK